MDYTVRALTTADEPILWTMIMYAAHEPSLESVQRQPILTRYVDGWGKLGDMGFVALEGEKAIASVWLRLGSEDDRGLGYIAPNIPELAMAVLPEYRGNGVGTTLLKQVLRSAEGLFPAICLSVRSDNPVVNLYQRLGFAKVEGSEMINRVGGISFNLVYKFIV
ncbi:MAG: GNAT family N-acetyltransferase [Pseudanabaena sp.]